MPDVLELLSKLQCLMFEYSATGWKLTVLYTVTVCVVHVNGIRSPFLLFLLVPGIANFSCVYLYCVGVYFSSNGSLE